MCVCVCAGVCYINMCNDNTSCMFVGSFKCIHKVSLCVSESVYVCAAGSRGI